MRNNLIILATLFILAITFSACSDKVKEYAPDPKPEKNEYNYLIEGQWQKKEYYHKLTVDGTTYTDSVVSPCEQDDLTTFLLSRIIAKDNGAQKCISNEPQRDSTGHWWMSPNFDTLRIVVQENDNSYTYADYKILRLTPDTLMIHYAYDTVYSGQRNILDMKVTYIKK